MIAHSGKSISILQRSVNSAKFTEPKSVFLATPMSGFSEDAEYRKHRAIIIDLINNLKEKYKLLDVYYAGTEVESKSDFSSSNIALDVDLTALREADVFVLVLPGKIYSSVLVEAGYAIACKIPMILMVKSKSDLPYFFQEAQNVQDDSELVPSIKICEYDSEDNLKFYLDQAILNSFSENIE